MLQPEIKTLPETLLVGICRKMSLTNNQTAQLWQSFMPRRREIQNSLGTELYSLQVYPPSYFQPFRPDTVFEKWALAKVQDHQTIPGGMQAFVIPGGLYAVFYYKGPSWDKSIFQYIFSDWLPASPYQLADRPHFEVLGGKYSNTTEDSEEEIWIPVES